jgi:hypothetical protein
VLSIDIVACDITSRRCSEGSLAFREQRWSIQASMSRVEANHRLDTHSALFQLVLFKTMSSCALGISHFLLVEPPKFGVNSNSLFIGS